MSRTLTNILKLEPSDSGVLDIAGKGALLIPKGTSAEDHTTYIRKATNEVLFTGSEPITEAFTITGPIHYEWFVVDAPIFIYSEGTPTVWASGTIDSYTHTPGSNGTLTITFTTWNTDDDPHTDWKIGSNVRHGALRYNSDTNSVVIAVREPTGSKVVFRTADNEPGSYLSLSSASAGSYVKRQGDTILGDLVLTGTSRIQLSGGSVSTPSLTFTNDTSTGLYLNAVDEAMVFVVDGTERARVSKSGLGTGDIINVEVAIENLAANPRPGIIIPFYNYPNLPYTDADCQALFAAIRKYNDVPVILIINPENGPDDVVDGNYTAFIKLARAAGAKVIGYVSTDYANRDPALVYADVDTWLESYPEIQGIFLDEQPWDTGPGNVGSSYVELYNEYYEYIHRVGLGTVVANPGVSQQSAWFETPTADIILVHENSYWPPPTLLGNFIGGNVDYPTEKRGALVYNQSELDVYSLRKLCQMVKWVFITSENLPNPWDELPPYLDELFFAVNDASNAIGSGLTILESGATIDWDASITKTAKVVLGQNAVLSNPTDAVEGQEYTLLVIQGGTGYTLNYDTAYANTATITAAANTCAVVKFVYAAGKMIRLQGVSTSI